MRKRILSLLLTACLIFAAIPTSSYQVKAVDSSAQNVVYVPLDDRPFNDSRVKTMAESLNIQLITPDRDLYATKLDGQTENTNGTQYGSREALVTWLQEMDKTYDTFIISMDQLLSGGLMNARCMTEMTALHFADGSSMTEYEVIDFLAELAENNTLYLIDSVARLASACDFDGYTINHYWVTRAYGMVGRPVFYRDDLTVEHIIASYPYAADGHTKAYLQANLSSEELEMLLSPKAATQSADSSALVISAFLRHQDIGTAQRSERSEAEAPQEDENSLLQEYLAIRTRQLLLTDYAMDTLCGMKNVHYLLGVDDSSDGNNIQRNEIALFQRYLTGNDQIFSALDGLGQTALSKIFLEQYPLEDLRVSVSCFGEEMHRVLSFNCFTVSEILDDTLRYFGVTHVDTQADLSVVVVTASGGNSNQMLSQLVSTLNENEYHHIPTILIDLTDTAEPALNDILVENTHLGMLLSFSGGGELPNGIVMGLSQGIARYRSLELPGFQTDATQRAHLQSLSTALIKEIGYRDGACQEMRTYLTELGIAPNNFKHLEEDTQIFNELTSRIQANSQALLDNLTSSNLITGLSPYTTGSIQDLTIQSCWYPWLRQIEIDCTLSEEWSQTPYTQEAFHGRFIDGTSETTFEPTEYVTREQTAKLLVSILGLSVSSASEPCPEDVSDWAWPYVYTAVQRGYMKGYPDGTLGGDRNILRAEFAALLMQYVQAEGVTLPSTESIVFCDVADDDSEWYNPHVYALARAGIIRGDAEGTFRPNDPISRVEAVALLTRLTGRTEELSSSLLDHVRFADVTADWHIPVVQEGSVSHFCKSAH